MPESLLEQLPEIAAKKLQVTEQKRKVSKDKYRAGLQAREWVLPARDSAAAGRVTAGERQTHLAAGQQAGRHNRVIYIDPPFDFKANCRTRGAPPGVALEQKPKVIEQFA